MFRIIRDVAEKVTARIYCPRCGEKGMRHCKAAPGERAFSELSRCRWLVCKHCSIKHFDYIWHAFNGRTAPPPEAMRKQ